MEQFLLRLSVRVLRQFLHDGNGEVLTSVWGFLRNDELREIRCLAEELHVEFGGKSEFRWSPTFNEILLERQPKYSIEPIGFADVVLLPSYREHRKLGEYGTRERERLLVQVLREWSFSSAGHGFFSFSCDGTDRNRVLRLLTINIHPNRSDVKHLG